MRHGIATLTCLSLLLAACGRTPPAGPAGGDAAAPAATTPASVAAAVAEVLTAGSVEFPVIPPIMVPGIVGSGPAQKRLEASMQALIDPIAGITVRPANCTTDGALVNESGFTNVDAQGNLQRISDQGVFEIGADGSGHVVSDGEVVEVAADGSGSIVNDAGVFEVRADGSGTYVGEFGNIELDGKGGGTWIGEFGSIENRGDGSGRWVGEEGHLRPAAASHWPGWVHQLLHLPNGLQDRCRACMLLCAWGARVTAVADHGPKLVALSGLRIVPALAAPVGTSSQSASRLDYGHPESSCRRHVA